MIDITTILQALLLGIVEGLTEFIPVSSTGHLILLIDIIGFKGPPGEIFEIIIQLGAIFAVCWLYRHKIFSVILGLQKDRDSQKFALNVCLAFLPAAILGVLLHSFIKSVLFSPLVVSISLVIGGVLILIIEKNISPPKYNSIEELPWRTAVYIGIAQTFAMIPGTSRSGATIMGALLFGVERKVATEFSFFLAIPTMFGATAYDVYKNYDALSLDNAGIIAIGFFSAFFSALLIIRTVITFISSHGFAPFAYYRIVLGALMLWLLLY